MVLEKYYSKDSFLFIAWVINIKINMVLGTGS